MLAAAAVLSLKKTTTTTTTTEEEEEKTTAGLREKSDAEKADEPVDTVWGVGRRRRGRCESKENSSDDDDDDDDAEEKEGWNDDFDNERDDEEEKQQRRRRRADAIRGRFSRGTHARAEVLPRCEERTEVLERLETTRGKGGKDAECRRPKIQNRYDGENRGGG